ncbi:DNA-binding response regulator (plasmid) [Fulvitalea axinellae]|uniref:DNA-binding response regulator n=2 Tax=Fulvitalea axinellae TaxID=1182444 RepID=A0AAU9DJQ7_9BACT|nr:DNA-binding response regulator [Fulvitalea axinellae]
MNLNCLIVDDESLARRVIKRFLDDVPFLTLVGECKNAIEASQAIRENDIDLIFLDINMPKLSGLDFLKTLPNPPMAIVTTAYREYALEGYELDVVDYITKPIAFDRFLKAVNKAQKRKEETMPPQSVEKDTASNFFFVKTDKKLQKINADDILYIEGFGEYVKIHTEKECVITYLALKSLEESLSPSIFVRVHKSFIISIPKINNVEANIIRIQQHRIPVGQGYKKRFLDKVKALTR